MTDGIQGAGSSGARRRLLRWGTLYLLVALALTVTSRVMDARFRTPTGLVRTFYDGDTMTGTPRFQVQTTAIDLDFVDADPTLPRRSFGVKWEGVWNRRVDQWIDLYGSGDDLVRITLDDAVVLERNLARGTGARMARFLLPAGRHRLSIEFEQYGADYLLYVGVANAGAVPGPIDPESLFPRRPSLKSIETNRQLSWLRGLVWIGWFAPPVLYVCVLAWPSARRLARRLGQHWVARSAANWRRLWIPAPARAPSLAAADRPDRRIVPWVAAIYGLVMLVVLVSLWSYHEPDTGFTTFIRFGEQFDARALPAVKAVPHVVHDGSGYDGQFYAQLALSPLLRDAALVTALDSVRFRARRILLSWTAYVAGGGEPARVLQAYATQNVVFWLLLGAVLLRWLPPVSVRSLLAWCGCLLGAGAIGSVRFALTDLPAATLMALAFLMGETGRPYGAGSILALAGLARETSLLALVGLRPPGTWEWRSLVRWAWPAVLAVAPLVLWIVYVQSRLRHVPTMGDDGSLALPLMGLVDYSGRLIRNLRFDGWGAFPASTVASLVGVLVQALYLGWRAAWHRPWWRLGIAYAALLIVLPFPVFEGTPGAFLRVLLPLTLAFNVLVPESRWFWPLVIVGNASVVQGIQALWRP